MCIVMILWEHRIQSIKNINSLIIYGLLCTFIGVIIVEVHGVFKEPIAILIIFIYFNKKYIILLVEYLNIA